VFTGIIEEVGTLRESGPFGGGYRIRIECNRIVEDLRPGGSVSVSGACLTATDVRPDGFQAELSPETVARSTLARLPMGTAVNLERSLRLSDRLEGHLVTGHVDSTGRVRAIRQQGDYVEIEYSAPPEVLRLVVEKGSIAVDGISLTVAGLFPDSFRVAVIPESVRRTNLSRIEAGDAVNLECDLIGKYVERFIGNLKPSGGVTLEKLQEHGYA